MKSGGNPIRGVLAAILAGIFRVGTKQYPSRHRGHTRNIPVKIFTLKNNVAFCILEIQRNQHTRHALLVKKFIGTVYRCLDIYGKNGVRGLWIGYYLVPFTN